MKKIIALLIIFTQFYIHPKGAYAILPFEEVGQFYDILPGNHPLHIAGVVSLLESERLKNYRMYADTDTSCPEDCHFPNQLSKLRVMGYRGEDHHDMPQSHIAFILQRLFPSPDGLNIIPNQGSTLDPVRKFNPQVIGTVLNYIADFYKAELNTEEAFAAYAQDLAFEMDRTLNPQVKSIQAMFDKSKPLSNREGLKRTRAKQNSHKPIFDFALSLVRALDQQRTPSKLWEPYLVEKALFAFALMKAAEAEVLPPGASAADDVLAKDSADSPFVREMKSFYAAMPDIVPTPVYGKAFSFDEYKGILERVKTIAEAEGDGSVAIDLTSREIFLLMFGLKSFAQVFPEQHFYSTTEYKGIKFSNCGEVSFLNLMNCLLWDFESKRLRVEILEEMSEFILPAMLEYYRTFSTMKEQMTRRGQLAWTKVVSNLGEMDPHIFYQKGEHTCEIMGGLPSMMGVVRALFRDTAFQAISRCQSCDPEDKAEATLDHLLELFSKREGTGAGVAEGVSPSAPQEIWTWKNAGAKEGEDPHKLSGANAKIEFSKEGANRPVVDDQPLEGALATWTLEKAHYDCTFSLSDTPEYLEEFANKLLDSVSDDSGALYDPPNLWCISDHADLGGILSPQLGLGEIDEDEPLLQAIANRLTPERMLELLQLGTFGTNCQDLGAQVMTVLVLTKAKVPHLYRFVANVLELLPRGDMYATLAVLPSLLGEDDKLPNIDDLPNIHPRVTRRMEEILDEVRDPKRASECLQNTLGISNVSICLLRIMAGGVLTGEVSKEDVLKVFYQHSEDDDSTSEFWNEFLDMYEGSFVTEGEALKPEELMLYRPDEKFADSALVNLIFYQPDDVFKLFLKRRLITKDMVLELLRNAPKLESYLTDEGYYLPFPYCSSLGRLKQLLAHFQFTCAEVSEAYPEFLQKLIDTHIYCKKKPVNPESILHIFEILGVTMATPLCEGGGAVGVAIAQQNKQDLLELCLQKGRMTKEAFLEALSLKSAEGGLPYFDDERFLWLVERLALTGTELNEARPEFADERIRRHWYNPEQLLQVLLALGMGLDTRFPESNLTAGVAVAFSAGDEVLDRLVRDEKITKTAFLDALRAMPQEDKLPYLSDERFLWLVEMLALTSTELEDARPGFVKEIVTRLEYNLERLVQVLLALGMGFDTAISSDQSSAATLVINGGNLALLRQCIERGDIQKDHFFAVLRNRPEGAYLPFFEKEKFLLLMRELRISPEELGEDCYPLISQHLYSVETAEDVDAFLDGLGIDMHSVIDREKGTTTLSFLVGSKPDVYMQLVQKSVITKEHVLEALRVLSPDRFLIFSNGFERFVASCRTLGISAEDIEDARANFFDKDAIYNSNARALFDTGVRGEVSE